MTSVHFLGGVNSAAARGASNTISIVTKGFACVKDPFALQRIANPRKDASYEAVSTLIQPASLACQFQASPGASLPA